MKFRSLCLIGSLCQKSQENIERNSVPCIQMPVKLMFENTRMRRLFFKRQKSLEDIGKNLILFKLRTFTVR